MVSPDQEHFSKGGWGRSKGYLHVCQCPVGFTSFSVNVQLKLATFYQGNNISLIKFLTWEWQCTFKVPVYDNYIDFSSFILRYTCICNQYQNIYSIVLCRNYDFMFGLKICLFQSFSLYITLLHLYISIY